jgi:UDP:flavonoid glycosyltransferase YjiC (YdhE family)
MQILAMPDGNWLSHVSRVLEIAKSLRAMGHRVLFAAEGSYTKLARDARFEVHPVKTLDPHRALQCSRTGRASWLTYELLREHVEEERRLFDCLRPDLVLGDFRLSLSTSCELARIPLAVLLNAAWTNYYAVRLKAPEHLAITRLLGKRLATWLMPAIKHLILKVDVGPFNRHRRELGLAPRYNVFDVWRGDLNLLLDIPEYGPTRNLPSNYHYVGPVIWEPDIPVPSWLERLDPHRPTVYFTMGSTGNPRFFREAIEAFGGSEYQCLVTTAGLVQLRGVPDNFFITDYAPGSKLMEQSDVAVCQGGNGTIYQALAAGVPIIGIPTMHDQEFNLDRVESLGVGIHVSELRYRRADLVQAVRKVLSEKGYKENARRYQEVLSRWNAQRTGAQIIDAFLAHAKSGKAREAGTAIRSPLEPAWQARTQGHPDAAIPARGW